MSDCAVPAFHGGAQQPENQMVVVVDVERYTRRSSAEQVAISALIEPLVDDALTASGLDEVRRDKRFARNTGDGVVFGCAPAYSPQLLHPFLAELEAALGRCPECLGSEPLRMRAALTSGPLPLHGGPGDGNGEARNQAHRLVDSDVIRHAMAVADPWATRLVAIVSERVYRDTVAAGYGSVHPSRMIEVTAAVDDKSFKEQAWLFVPVPSGGLLRVPEPPARRGGAVYPGRRGGRASGRAAAVRPGDIQAVTQDVSNGMALMGGVVGDIVLGFGSEPGAGGRGPCR
ncbi:hypothetical protein ACIQF6_35395 [Kitasatospora sp. NPDC092948]|uniref:hypothetical protein n=1 Tax=Kitasatospora sp. NPDC092948 TaxID=3364088 RepID=UPI0038212382